MTREARNEIRKVLLGKTMLTQDGKLTAMKAGDFRLPLGVTDGAASARFLGIFRRGCRLEISCSEKEARKLAERRMLDLGRALVLAEQPEAAACLIRYVLTKPAVLVFDFDERGPVLTAWTGKGLMGLLSLRRAIKAFTRDLPGQMRVGEALEKERRQKKRAKKERKLERKQRKNRNAGKAAAGETASGTEE